MKKTWNQKHVISCLYACLCVIYGYGLANMSFFRRNYKTTTERDLFESSGVRISSSTTLLFFFRRLTTYNYPKCTQHTLTHTSWLIFFSFFLLFEKDENRTLKLECDKTIKRREKNKLFLHDYKKLEEMLN